MATVPNSLVGTLIKHVLSWVRFDYSTFASHIVLWKEHYRRFVDEGDNDNAVKREFCPLSPVFFFSRS